MAYAINPHLPPYNGSDSNKDSSYCRRRSSFRAVWVSGRNCRVPHFWCFELVVHTSLLICGGNFGEKYPGSGILGLIIMSERLKRSLGDAISQYLFTPESRPRLPHFPTHRRNVALMGALNDLLVPYMRASEDLVDTHSIL